MKPNSELTQAEYEEQWGQKFEPQEETPRPMTDKEKARERMIGYLVSFFGSKSNMALQIGVTRQSITPWIKNGIPYKQAIEIERVSNGHFKAVDLVAGGYEDARR